MSNPNESAPETVLGLDPRALFGLVKRSGGTVRRLGDYELLERIAEGGMGVVWRARQVSLGRVVAVKMIRSGLLASDEEVARFRREAEAAAALDHPNIVPIHEVGEDEGRHFFSMKLIEGGNLAEFSANCDAEQRRDAAWTRRAAEIVTVLARALYHAHQRGVLHRDMKPTNVLLDAHGTPHLTDFGLAKLTDGAATMTQTLSVIGTPHYMAPEQAAGNSQQLTVAADIYSLGAVLYALLCGHPPFEADSTLELLRQVQEREPEPPMKANPGVSRDLETICLKCLQKEPTRRYASAEELAADLERWLAGKPILARPAGPLERLWLWSRRNRLATAAGLLLLALALVSALAALRLREQRNEVGESLSRSHVAQAHAQRLGTAPDRRAENLRILAEAARTHPTLEARNEAIATLALPALGPPQTWHATKPQRFCHQMMISADGSRYALFGETSGISVHLRADDAVLAELATPPGHYFAGELSPDGRWLVNFDQANTAFIWDLNAAANTSRQPTRTIPGPWAHHPGFSSDSRTLAIAGNDRTVRLLDMENGTETRRLEFPFIPFQVYLAPLGDRIAVFNGQQLEVRSFATGVPGQHTHFSPITALAWHPAGRHVAVGYKNGEVQLYDCDLRRARWLEPHRQDVWSLSFDPRGEILVSSAQDSTQHYLDIATGRVLFETKEAGHLHATGDGRWFVLLADDGGVRARENLPSGVFRTLSSARRNWPGLSGVDFSPDGRWVVSGDFEGLHVWDATNGNELAFLASRSAWRPRFHPSRNFLVTAGKGEILRWPFETPVEEGPPRVGTPEKLVTEENEMFSEVDFTPDGAWMLATSRPHSFLFNWNEPSQRIALGSARRPADHDFAVIDPQRRWAAGASFGGAGVSVWEPRDGSLLRGLIDNENARVAVSPDGTTLATATVKELVLWDTATWQPRLRRPTGMSGTIPIPVAFSPDGALLAAATTRQEIALHDARTGAVLAMLTAPVPLNLVTLRFSRDSCHLATQTLGPAIQLWDLQALRSELRTLGLEWEK